MKEEVNQEHKMSSVEAHKEAVKQIAYEAELSKTLTEVEEGASNDEFTQRAIALARAKVDARIKVAVEAEEEAFEELEKEVW
jgi:hypothetical protein